MPRVRQNPVIVQVGAELGQHWVEGAFPCHDLRLGKVHPHVYFSLRKDRCHRCPFPRPSASQQNPPSTYGSVVRPSACLPLWQIAPFRHVWPRGDEGAEVAWLVAWAQRTQRGPTGATGGNRRDGLHGRRETSTAMYRGTRHCRTCASARRRVGAGAYARNLEHRGTPRYSLVSPCPTTAPSTAVACLIAVLTVVLRGTNRVIMAALRRSAPALRRNARSPDCGGR